MNSLRLKPFTLAMIAVFAVARTAVAGVEPRLHEDISVSPGRSITPDDEAAISSSAIRVLHHIARARDALRKNDVERARQDLKQAEILLDIIQASVPTTVVKNRVWTSDNRVKYEDSEEVPASIVPIYASLTEQADFDTVKLPGAAPRAKANAKPDATAETETGDAALYYEERDLPLNATRHFVAAALIELARNRPREADQALRAAQGSVDFVSVYLPAPLLAASINLERAEVHYGAGRTEQAREDVARAIAQLTAAEKQTDPDSHADVKLILAEAQSLHARMDKNEPGIKAELTELWHRAEAHADRAMAYTTFGWAKLRQHDPLRGALIEAKRYVAYADIDANVTGDGKQAMRDLEQASSWLDKAAEDTGKASNGQDAAVYVKDIRAVVDSLLAGQAKPGAGEMADLKQQLAQAIARL
jgi:YfdX protein